jgi:hypothetical protein
MLFNVAIVATLALGASAFPGHWQHARQGGASTSLAPAAFARWSPTDSNNLAPCPFTNSLANHGLLDRDNMTVKQIKDALSALQCDGFIQNLFSGNATMGLGRKLADGTEVVSLTEVAKHGGIEHGTFSFFFIRFSEQNSSPSSCIKN